MPSNRNIYVFSYSKGKAMGIASLSIPSTPLMLCLGQFDIESSIIEINGDNDSNIYFTTDGTAPNSSSKLYSSFVNDYICTDGIKRNGIKVKNSDIIKSIAINSFDIKSKITSTLYYSWNKYTGFNSPINGYSIWKTTNQGVSNSYAVKKVTFSSYGDVTIYIRSSSDINKDYVMISKLNPTEIPQNIYSVSCNNYIYGSKTGYAHL